MLDPNPETRLTAAHVVAHPWFRRGLAPELAGLNNRLILARAGLTAEDVPTSCMNSAEVRCSGLMANASCEPAAAVSGVAVWIV